MCLNDPHFDIDSYTGHVSRLKPAYPVEIINRQSVGICIGASTISLVKIEALADGSIQIVERQSFTSHGNPQNLLKEALPRFASSPLPAVVTGRKFRKRVALTSISEPEAIESAMEIYQDENHQFAALASLGAETFVVYELDHQGRIRKLISRNQCASGTGEFFMQQIGRMDLDLDEAVRISMNSTPFKVSGRCSVFCKSDCTHALNKGIPKEEVAAGLALMIAEKAEELLKKSHPGRFMLVGGVTQNRTVIEFLKKKYPDLYIPNEAPFFEALGAAVYGLHHEVSKYDNSKNVFVDTESLFTFHKPLPEFR
ncbi:MAG: BadF/BadG/BcrA/BcrD ATPase family protein, partial [Bacteroidota bacterium]|nr:BadF/BadG/BcrA/BcrD ATPase family protein [Bacteroidota bacterium]